MFQPGPGLNDGTDEGGLNGGKDAYVWDEQPSSNFGAALSCGTSPISTCNQTNLRGFIKFDVSSLPAVVDSVIFSVHFPDQLTCFSNCSSTYTFNYVDQAWNEMGITWDNQPSPGDAFGDTVALAAPEPAGERRYDITDAYLAWRSGTRVNHGFMFVPLDGICNNAAVILGFFSSDQTEFPRPQLLVYANTIGMQEHTAWSTLRITPNPAADAAFLDAPAAIGAYRVEVLDGMGRVILQQGAVAGMRLTLALDGLGAGVYFIRLGSDRFGTAVRRLVKP